jgi:ligand-binding SRPBCC domain-containing protein
MSQIKYDVEINAPVERVYEYYTNPDNIQEAWPQDIVKESESLSPTKNEQGSEMKVKGEYMGKEEEMRLQVVDKQQNRRLVTKQVQGPFKKWESI